MARAERGDVWLIDFGMAAKVRPALLLTGEPSDDELDLFTVLLHTTSTRGNRLGVSYCEDISEDRRIPSSAGAKLIRRLGRLSPAEFGNVTAALMARLGF